VRVRVRVRVRAGARARVRVGGGEGREGLVDEFLEAQLRDIVHADARALTERGDGGGGLRRCRP
jgi:hypothetical protein